MSYRCTNEYWLNNPPEPSGHVCHPESCEWFEPNPFDGLFGICAKYTDIRDGNTDIDWHDTMPLDAKAECYF